MSTTTEAPTGNLVIDTITVQGRTIQFNENLELEYVNTPEVLDAYFAEKTVKEEALADGTYEYTFEKDTDTSSKTKRSNVVKEIHTAINAILSPQNKEVKLIDIQAVIDIKATGSKWPIQEHKKDATLTFNQYKKETKIYYKKITAAPMGYQVYLVTETKNLKDQKVKLKIHEKEDTLKLLKTKDEVLPVLAFAKEDDTTTDTEISDWIEIDVKEKSGKKENGDLFLYKEETEDKIEVGIKKIQLRPKEDKIKTEGEDASKSFEGWQEALYVRENETKEGKKAIEDEKAAKTARDKEEDTLLKFDDKASKKTYPAGKIDAPKTAIVGKVIEYVLDIDIDDVEYKKKRKNATEEDKKNIRWSFYVQDTSKADKKSTYITTKSKTGLYTYAKTEIVGKEIKLTIVFDEALIGKKVQIEPFRGSPDLSNTPPFVRTTTIQKVPDPKISIRETTSLWLTTQCEGGPDAGGLIDKEFKSSFKLETPNTIHIYHDGKMSLLELDGLDKIKYVYYDKNGDSFLINTCDLLKIRKKAVGNPVSVFRTETAIKTIDYESKNISGVDAKTSRVYSNGDVITDGKKYGKEHYKIEYKCYNEEVVLVHMKLINRGNTPKMKFHFHETLREYSNPYYYGAFIGALADIGFDVSCGGSCYEDGTAFPSLEHSNGYAIDTGYIYNKASDEKIMNALKKFGFKKRRRGSTTYLDTLTGHSSRDKGSLHDTHLHSGKLEINEI